MKYGSLVAGLLLAACAATPAQAEMGTLVEQIACRDLGMAAFHIMDDRQFNPSREAEARQNLTEAIGNEVGTYQANLVMAIFDQAWNSTVVAGNDNKANRAVSFGFNIEKQCIEKNWAK